MATEFLADASERLVQSMRSLGVSAEVAGMVVAEWNAGIARDWGGERPYIGKRGQDASAEMSRRDVALLRDWHNGERVAALARKYRISARHVRRILAQVGPDLP